MKRNLLLVFLFLSILGYSQKTRLHTDTASYMNPNINGQSFSAFIEERFHKNIRMFDKTGIYGTKGACFIKFQIDSNGKIINRDFTSGVKQELFNFLFDCFEEAQKYWMAKKSKGKPIRSEFLVLPVYYEFPSGPNTKTIGIDPLELSRFFTGDESSEQITVLPSVYLHSGHY